VRRRKYYTLEQVAEYLTVEPRVVQLCVREELVRPRRYRGRTVVTHDEVERVRVVWTLTEELGVNLPGVEVALHLREQVVAQRESALQLMDEMQAAYARTVEQLLREIERLRAGWDPVILDAEE